MKSTLRPRSFRILFAAVIAVVLAACSSSKTRVPAELQDIVSPALAPQVLWSDSASDGDQGYFSGFRLALEPDALFAADAKGQVFALNPKTGTRLWRHETKARLISGPSIGGGLVLVGSLDGELIALKRADGAELWRTTLSSEILAAPATDGETIVARCVDGRIYALSAKDGARLWTFDRNVPNLTLRGLSPPLITGLRVLSGFDNGHLVSLKLSDGQLLWDQPVAVPSGRTELERLTDIDAALLDGEDALYALSFGGELAALDAGSGQVLWRRSIKSYTGATIAGSLLLATDNDGVIWALDAKTGAAAWKQDGLQYRSLGAPATFDGKVVVGDFDGYLHWIDPRDGKIIARKHVGGDALRAAPVAGDGVLYVMNTAGKITALSVSETAR
jgi:outer membrane protein assembly factor BamB